MRPDATAISDRLASIGAEVSDEALGVLARVPCPRVAEALDLLRDAQPAFETLVDLFAVDTGEGLELTYHVRSLSAGDLYVRCPVDYDGEVPSVWRVYPAALVPEREAAELFGLTLSGHPNPKRLLTTDEVEVPLLRKAVAIREGEEVRRDVR